MKKLFPLLFSLIAFFAQGQNAYYLVIGTYTKGKSEGIYVYEFNPATGEAKPVSITKGIANPSYLAVSPDRKYVYAVSEMNNGGNGGIVFSYTFDASTGIMQPINNQPSGGDDPCYVAVDITGQWVVAGNYSSGSLKVMKSDNGSLQESDRVFTHEGSGPNSERQEKAHVHSTFFSPNQRFVYVPDLGIDKIVTYGFDAKTGAMKRVSDVSVEPGGGPRHIEFHPNGRYAYVMEELKGRVSVFRAEAGSGKLTKIQSALSTADGFRGFAGSADIHISKDGRFLYASNRGDANDIAIFAVNSQTGMIKRIANQPVLGIAPRNFAIDPTGRYLLAANMNSDQIVVFARDEKTGKLTDTGKRINVPTPVCLKFVAKNGK